MVPMVSTRSDREGSLIVKSEDLKTNNELRQNGRGKKTANPV